MKTPIALGIMSALGWMGCSASGPTNEAPGLPFGTSAGDSDAGSACIGACTGASVAPTGGLVDVPFTGLSEVGAGGDVTIAGDRAAPVDVSLDAGVSDVGTVSPGQTYDYVINRMLLDNGAEPGVTTRAFFGFNLDDRYSPSRTASQQAADCSHGDYFSSLDPDQNAGSCVVGEAGGGAGCQGGVDNQLPNLAQTFIQFLPSLNPQMSIDEQINSGRGLILIRVSGVDGALGPGLNDSSVRVQVYPFAWPLFANCANVQNSNQSYVIDNRSLVTPGDVDSARIAFGGRIVNGRLFLDLSGPGATLPNFIVPILPLAPVEEIGVPMNLQHMRFRMNLGATEGTLGNLGGYVSQTEYVTALTTIPALMQFRDAAGPLIQGFVDVATGTPTLSCNSPQGAIGMGLGFTALRAILSDTTVSVPPSGVCGSSPRADAGTNLDAGYPDVQSERDGGLVDSGYPDIGSRTDGGGLLYHGWTSPVAGCSTSGYDSTAPTNLGGSYPYIIGDSAACRAWKLAATVCTTQPVPYSGNENFTCPQSGGFTDPRFGSYCAVSNQYSCSSCPGACNAGGCRSGSNTLRDCRGTELAQP